MSAPGNTPASINAPAGSGYTLRFNKWRCGHHGQRPRDIPVSTPEQAMLILQAISHAISQPGEAHAVVFDATHGIEIFLTDDYVAMGHGEARTVPERHRWSARPTVILCSEAEIEQINDPDLKDAVENLFWGLDRWDGKDPYLCSDTVTTTLTQAEVEAVAAPSDDWDDRSLPLPVPPLFRTGAEVLAELREEAESEATYQAELARENAEAHADATHPDKNGGAA